jgi:DNA-directed RNA polymerase specialized sigma24 family protein
MGLATLSYADFLSESDLLSAFDYRSPLTSFLMEQCHRTARHMSLNAADCDDYINGTYEAIWRHRVTTKFVDMDGLQRYSRVLLKRRMISATRRESANKRAGTIHLDDEKYFEPVAVPEMGPLSPEEIRDYLAEHGALVEMLNRECLLILEYVADGYTVKKAAEAMDIPPERAWKRIRALRPSQNP